MIDKNVIKTIVEEWLQGNEYFLVDVCMPTGCGLRTAPS